MPDYVAISKKVQGGFVKAGFAMTLQRTTRGTYDPATGTYSVDTTTDYTVYGLLQARSLYQTGAVGQNLFNGIMVQTDDQFVLLSAYGLSIVPSPEDKLVITGVSHTIMTMIPVRPGGIDLLYRILARK